MCAENKIHSASIFMLMIVVEIFVEAGVVCIMLDYVVWYMKCGYNVYTNVFYGKDLTINHFYGVIKPCC